MKTNYGDIWCETQPDGRMSIGFTKKCIEEKLCECFHVLPADISTAKLKQPLLVLETNDGVEAIPSPISGRIIIFSQKAKDFPDRMNEEDVVVSIEPPEVTARKLKEKRSAPRPTKIVDAENPFIIQDWLQFVQQPAIAPAPQVNEARAAAEAAGVAAQERINRALAQLRNRQPLEWFDNPQVDNDEE